MAHPKDEIRALKDRSDEVVVDSIIEHLKTIGVELVEPMGEEDLRDFVRDRTRAW